MQECLYVEFNEETQFFNEKGINDITLEVNKEYVAFKEGDKYRVKLKDGYEVYVPCNSNLLYREHRSA